MNNHFPNGKCTLHQIKLVFARNSVSSNVAQQLICDALNLSKEKYYLDSENVEVVDSKKLCLLNVYLNDAISHKPLQYILGYADFWKFTFQVTENTLIPRPETELIIEKALQYFSDRLDDELSILDLGTGSGILAICLKHEFINSKVLACDISESALNTASQNAHCILKGLGSDIKFIKSNWYEELDTSGGNFKDRVFDLIVSNPPYISLSEFSELDSNVKNYEPQVALTDGADGLLHYHQIIQCTKSYLKENGLLILEHGFNQRVALMKILIENDFKIVENVLDLAGLDRILIAKL